MHPSQRSWVVRLRSAASNWRNLLRPSVTAFVLVAVGGPSLLLLALTMNTGSTAPSSVSAGAGVVASGPSPVAQAPARHKADAVVAKVDGKSVTVDEVKALVAAKPEQARRIRFNNDVTRSEATALLGRAPTVAQLPSPAPEPTRPASTKPTATTSSASTTRPPASTSTPPTTPASTSVPVTSPTTTEVPTTAPPDTTAPPETTAPPATDPPPVTDPSPAGAALGTLLDLIPGL